MAEKARPLKLLGSVRPTWVQLLPLQVQVSSRKFVPSNPPKSTSWEVLVSKAISAPSRALGLVAGEAGAQVVPFQVQVS